MSAKRLNAPWVFVDRLQWASLWRILREAPTAEVLWYFDECSAFTRRALSLIRRIGLSRLEARQVTRHVGEMRAADGEGLYPHRVEEARQLCTDIARAHFSSHPLIAAMAPIWNPRIVAFYCEKLVDQEVSRACLRIGLASWMARESHPSSEAVTVLLCQERGRWFSALRAYARTHGIQLVGYRRMGATRAVRALWVGRLVQRLRRPRARAGSAAKGSPRSSVAPGRPRIALRYWFRALSLDALQRSELFWINEAIRASAEILVYDPTGSMATDATTVEQLAAQGIHLVRGGPRLTCRALGRFVKLTGRLISAAWRCRWQRQRVTWQDLLALGRLALVYSTWVEFFATHRVTMHVGTFNYDPPDVAITLALDSLGGVGIAYQYSISHLLGPYPTRCHSGADHVQMVFSRFFEPLWHRIEAPVKHYLPVGFIYDGALAAIRAQGDFRRLRQLLEAHGARLILCFFDENSVNRWDIYASHEDAMRDYEFLLKWVLSDPTLGLCIKVKSPATLSQRIAPLAPLIAAAKRTGRCHLLLQDAARERYRHPAEAALAADLCIGKLSGATAALEARLAGVPTLLIDTEAFLHHPLRVLGAGRVIFDDWNTLRTAVERYRAAGVADEAFGDWGPWLSQLDPFRDGRAAVRFAGWVQWVLEGLRAGLTNEAAVARAVQQYNARWPIQPMAEASTPLHVVAV